MKRKERSVKSPNLSEEEFLDRFRNFITVKKRYEVTIPVFIVFREKDTGMTKCWDYQYKFTIDPWSHTASQNPDRDFDQILDEVYWKISSSELYSDKRILSLVVVDGESLHEKKIEQ